MYVGRKYNSEEVLNFIRLFQGMSGGNSPTFADIQDYMNIPSKSVVRFYLDKLVEEGSISYVMSKGSKPKVRGFIVNQPNGQL